MDEDSEVLDYSRQDEHKIVPDEVIEKRNRVIDHQGLQTSNELEPQEEVVYEVKDEPSFNVTRAIFIGNLRRPIDAIEFQNYLKQLASKADSIVERAWLNRTRTHGVVLLDKDEGSQYLRKALNGKNYPSEEEDLKLKEEFERRERDRFELEQKKYEEAKEIDQSDEKQWKEVTPIREYQTIRMPLSVDYVPIKAINQWIFEEDNGPRNGSWKIVYESNGDEIVASHVLLKGDFMPRYNKNFSRRGRGSYRGGYRTRGRNKDSGLKPYGSYPPRRGGYQEQNIRSNRRKPYNPYRYERDSYVPGRDNRDNLHPRDF